MIEAQIGHKINKNYEKFERHDIMNILRMQVRVILNSKPAQLIDVLTK